MCERKRRFVLIVYFTSNPCFVRYSALKKMEKAKKAAEDKKLKEEAKQKVIESEVKYIKGQV